MTGTNRAAANGINARRSTGPRTPAGKARSRANALKHGLTVSARGNRVYQHVVSDLAHSLAPDRDESSEEFRAALEVSAAAVDVLRARQARYALLDRADGEHVANHFAAAAKELATTQAKLEASEEGFLKLEVLHHAALLQKIEADLQRLERYERRAASQRETLAALLP